MMGPGWFLHGRSWAGAYGPWSFGGRFFRSGEVRLALLSLLEERPKHGYELIKDLEARSGGLYRASAGTVYPTLQQLEDEGLVVAQRVEGKQAYSLTASGREELARNAVGVRGIWRRARGWEDWGRCMGPEIAVLAGSFADLMKTALRVARSVAHQPEQLAKVREVLEEARKRLEDVKAQ